MLRAKKPLVSCLFLLVAAAAPASANLIIIPTFASSITTDPNAAAIEGTINSAISIYEADIATPITVNITYQEGGGLGGSSFALYTISYTDFYAALQASATSANDAIALARLAEDGTGVDNPVTGTPTVLIKPANALALGFGFGPGGPPASDGTITLNTSLTTPGSPGSADDFNLLPVVEHETDEILGLGSTLGLGLSAPYSDDPSPEDFFRFDASGNRSFTSSGVGLAFFSLNGTTDLDQFDNQNDGGDFGDWQSNPLPAGVHPQVQDAFATVGADPSLGVELTALDVIGYTEVTPEPAFWGATATVLLALLAIRRRRAGHLGPAPLA
jgi:MYXO-CTERM domain-containing protein